MDGKLVPDGTIMDEYGKIISSLDYISKLFSLECCRGKLVKVINETEHTTQSSTTSRPSTYGIFIAGGFTNQTGGVPYVKIIEQPAGNKLRFRLVFADRVYQCVINSIFICFFCIL